MKRFAYLLSNNNGLPGVKKDVSDVRSFLVSCTGGAWLDNGCEILERENIGSNQVRQDLAKIKQMGVDYLFFYFSGHGDAERGLRLYLNREEEYIEERETFGLAQKLISIYDCCRYIPPTNRGFVSVCDEAMNCAEKNCILYRQKFDDAIRSASPQEVRLYACLNGECAMATQSGSLYTQEMLLRAVEMSKKSDADACAVHVVCKGEVSKRAKELGGKQNPDSEIVWKGLGTKPLKLSICAPHLYFG